MHFIPKSFHATDHGLMETKKITSVPSLNCRSGIVRSDVAPESAAQGAARMIVPAERDIVYRMHGHSDLADWLGHFDTAAVG